jgi:outer membrane protein assembly factor BamB
MIRFQIASRICLKLGVATAAVLATATAAFSQVLSAVTVSPNTVVGGNFTTGTVKLSSPAKAGGFTVPLSTNDPAATAPVWVIVPEGERVATFRLRGNPVVTDTPVIVTGTGGGNTKTANVTVLAPSVLTLVLNPTLVLAGNPSQAEVTLNGPAAKDGVKVAVVSDTGAALVPAEVLVPAGSSSAKFTVNTVGVEGSGIANISATAGVATKTATLKIASARLQSVTVAPNVLLGGADAVGTVTLDGVSPSFGSKVDLASDNGSAIFPASVTVLPGTKTITFPIKTTTVADDALVTISASFLGRTRTAKLTIQAPFATITVTPGTLIGGAKFKGTVTLSEVAKAGGAVVKLSASSAAATTPATVTVKAGAFTADFEAVSNPVPADEIVQIIATRGTSDRKAPLKVLAPTVVGLTLRPNYAIGGTGTIGVIKLTGKAAAGGVTVPVQSNRAAAVVPATATVPEGSDEGEFPITTTPVKTEIVATIRVVAGTKPTAPLRVTPGPGLDTNSAWPKFRGNWRNDGQGVGPAAAGTLKWTYAVRQGMYSSPALASDGTVYVAGDDAEFSLEALNPDGTRKWVFGTGGAAYSSPVVATDGRIYVASFNDLFAVNPDGTKKWQFTTGGLVLSSPTIGPDGTIYVGSYDNSLYAINPNGTLRWKFATTGRIYSSPAIGPDGTIYVGSADKSIYAITADGAKMWSVASGAAIFSSPAVDSKGNVYVGSDDGNVYALKPDGTKLWTYAAGAAIGNSSPAIGVDGTVYIGAGRNLVAITNKGVRKWVYGTANLIQGSPVIAANGTVYVGSTDTRLYAFSSTGVRLWFFNAGGEIYSTPAIAADGTLYFGTLGAKIHAIK